jgi:nitroreductase
MAWNFTPERFAAFVADAVHAPSMHNTQPWRFRLSGDAIDVLLDRDRLLPVGDPAGRAARVACGCALLNLRLALAVGGHPADVRLVPEPDVIARLTPAHPQPATPTELRLHAAIPRRHSNRHPFADIPVPADVRTDLVRAARDEQAWLRLAESPEEAEATADVIREADRLLRSGSGYATELATWTGVGEHAPEGVPAGAGGPEPGQHELLTRRDFAGAPGTRPFEREPLIGVLGAAGDLAADQVVAGMALQRVLLTATDLGLAASIFTQPIDHPATRERLRAVWRRPYPPFAVLRFGYGTVRPHHSGRRPVPDVIVSPALERDLG